jgi:hypothetical protein
LLPGGRPLSLRLDSPEAVRKTLTIHPTLIERESVGPALFLFTGGYAYSVSIFPVQNILF